MSESSPSAEAPTEEDVGPKTRSGVHHYFVAREAVMTDGKPRIVWVCGLCHKEAYNKDLDRQALTRAMNRNIAGWSVEKRREMKFDIKAGFPNSTIKNVCSRSLLSVSVG